MNEKKDSEQEMLTFNTKYSAPHEPVKEQPISGDEVDRTKEGYPIIEVIN